MCKIGVAMFSKSNFSLRPQIEVLFQYIENSEKLLLQNMQTLNLVKSTTQYFVVFIWQYISPDIHLDDLRAVSEAKYFF